MVCFKDVEKWRAMRNILTPGFFHAPNPFKNVQKNHVWLGFGFCLVWANICRT